MEGPQGRFRHAPLPLGLSLTHTLSLLSPWKVRKAALLDERIELYDEQTNDKIAEFPILCLKIKLLDGFAFSLRTMDGMSCTIFDSDSLETRRRWVSAISYQIAFRAPFQYLEFPYAPKLGDDSSSLTIVCGNLQKKGRFTQWKPRFFKLTPHELLYYSGEVLKGVMQIDGATIKGDERTHELTVRSTSGVVLVLTQT